MKYGYLNVFITLSLTGPFLVLWKVAEHVWQIYKAWQISDETDACY